MRLGILSFILFLLKYSSLYSNVFLCDVTKYKNTIETSVEHEIKQLERKYVITLKEKDVLSYSYLPNQEKEPFEYSYLILKQGMFGTLAVNINLQDIISIDALSFFQDLNEGTHVLQFPTHVQTWHFKCKKKN